MGKRIEVLVSGFGGQGVVRIGQIMSQSAVNEGFYATMLISHGTETRGGYVRSQVVISDEFVDSPVVENPDYFIALSKAAYNRFSSMVKEGIIIYDPFYVEVNPHLQAKHIAVPARDTAINELGRELYANVIVVGYLTRMMDGLLKKDNVLKVMLEKIPKFHEENKQAFALGYAMAEKS